MTSSDEERQAGDQGQTSKDKLDGPGNRHRSGGPSSEAGKAASSLNSTKHGILSGHLFLKGENSADFVALIDQLYEALKPVGAFEEFQVERIAVGIWRQRRLVRAETEQIERQRVHLRAEERVLYTEALELLLKDINAIGGSDKIFEQASKEVYGGVQAEWSLYENLINNTDKKDWELLADKAPHIHALLQADAEKKELPVIDFLNDYTSIAEWVKTKIAQQKQALSEMARISAQDMATNSESNDTSDASKKAERSPEKNTANIIESRWIPSNMEVLGRYQTMLDNQVYKALKALFDAQEARRKANEYTGIGNIVAEQQPGE